MFFQGVKFCPNLSKIHESRFLLRIICVVVMEGGEKAEGRRQSR